MIMYIIILIICIITIIIFFVIIQSIYNIFPIYEKYNYNPIMMNKEISLFHIPNFLTSEECDHIIKISQDKFARSGVVISGKNSYQNTRTSQTHYLKKSQDNIIKSIEKRVSLTVKKPIECIESLQVVKYEPGQEFKEHHDWFRDDYRKTIKNNQRQYTFFVYLNNISNGGITRFPKLNLSFKPQKGTALFWTNCIKHDLCYENNLHQGEPPQNEIKYGLNIWINFDKID